MAADFFISKQKKKEAQQRAEIERILDEQIKNVRQKKQENNQVQEVEDFDTLVLSCSRLYKNQDFKEAAGCFNNLYNNYPMNEVKFNEGLALLYSNQVSSARSAFEYVIKNENQKEELIADAKRMLEAIEKKEYEFQEEENMRQEDFGDYLGDFNTVARWKNPKNIKVYVDYNDPEREVFKDAFRIWDDALGDTVNFTFINNPNNADITCYHTDVIKEVDKAAGITKPKIYHYNNDPDKNFMSKAAIEVLRKDIQTKKKYSDVETKSITLHEIGHALGLIQGHSSKRYDIMYKDTSSYMNDKARPSNRDINTIKKIYML